MKEMSVRYLINDEEEARLNKIYEKYKERVKELGYDNCSDINGLFETIMMEGSRSIINDKLKFNELRFGLRDRDSLND